MSHQTLLQMIDQLIATPSVSSINPHWDQTNEGVIGRLEHWFTQLGFRVEVLPIPGFAGKFNLIASAGNGPEGLVLSGHTDTVPYDEGVKSLELANAITLSSQRRAKVALPIPRRAYSELVDLLAGRPAKRRRRRSTTKKRKRK